MQVRRAVVDWLPKEQGGRSEPPSGHGPRPYAAVVQFSDDPWPDSDTWSLVVEMDPALSDRDRWFASVHFLAEDAPHDSLQRGRSFTLYEGRRCVAQGTILGDSTPSAVGADSGRASRSN